MTHRITRQIYAMATALAMAVYASSCAEPDFDLPMASDGVADIVLNLTFNSYGTQADKSRAAAGNAISEVNDLSILAFTPSGNLVSTKYYTKADGLNVSNKSQGTLGDDYENDDIYEVTVPLLMPFGQYHIYAVANMGDPAVWATDVVTESHFRSLSLDWDEDVSRNNQMCGVVTQATDQPLANRDAVTVVIDRTSSKLHCWLLRAVSKVTIAYDASNLNENIFIYIGSARVVDIPRQCTMIDYNVPQAVEAGNAVPSPSECLVAEGESISYLNNPADPKSSRVVLSRGSSYGGLRKVSELKPGENVHLIDEESLFFFENMQGKHDNKHQYNNFPSKDNVEYGTYIEVEAHYLNRSAATSSSGTIKYRYMLGMNDIDDFNALRNIHFRVTLRFNGDANNPDWHIDYNHPTVPTVDIPDPLYISYLYNQRLDITVNCRFDPSKYYVKNIDAEITANGYTNPEHPYANVSKWSDTKYGFLSFKDYGSTFPTTVDISDPAHYQGSVHYNSFDGTEYDVDRNVWHFEIPAFTRPLNLLAPDGAGSLRYAGFSGNNNHVNKHRHASINVVVTFGAYDDPTYVSTVIKDINIVQVNRIINPRGIWRPADSMEKFRVVLMNSLGDPTNVSSIQESNVQFSNLGSQGPWSVKIYTDPYSGNRPGYDWIELSRDGEGKWGKEVSGSTSTQVRFDFRPKSVLAPGEAPRFGIIEVMYHNHQCRHLIFVSQGYGTVKVGSNEWMMGNLYAEGTEVENPLLEGSMFKYGNLRYGLRARNNFTLEGNQDRDAGPFKDASTVNIWWARRDYADGKFSPTVNEAVSSRYGPVAANLTKGFDDNDPALRYKATADGTIDGAEYRMATYDDFAELLDADRFGMTFGIMYGAETNASLLEQPDRYTTPGDVSGMRGCFVYDRVRGTHLFLPIGATGNGRRKVYYRQGSETRYAALKYSEYDTELSASEAEDTPILYDVYRKGGALYWYRNYNTDSRGKIQYGFDINYYTLQAKHNESQMLYDYGSGKFANPQYEKPAADWANENSDAAYVRRIKR